MIVPKKATVDRNILIKFHWRRRQPLDPLTQNTRTFHYQRTFIQRRILLKKCLPESELFLCKTSRGLGGIVSADIVLVKRDKGVIIAAVSRRRLMPAINGGPTREIRGLLINCIHSARMSERWERGRQSVQNRRPIIVVASPAIDPR